MKAEGTSIQSSRLRRGIPWIAGLVSLAIAAAIYVLRVDHVVGLAVDDAWYVLLAKALATGQGYTLINAPTPNLMPFYPPGFPFLLSLVFRIAPNFPANLPLLKAVSVIAMLLAGVVSCWYFVRVRELPYYLALSISAAAVIAPPIVFISTSLVMSEPVFMLAQLLAITLVELGVKLKDNPRAWGWIALGAACTSFAMLVRTMAISLVAGVILYLLWKRMWRGAAIFLGVVVLLYGPWMIYTRTHAPTLEQRREQNGYIVQDYATQFWQRRAGSISSGTITVELLPDRVWNNLTEMGLRDAGELLVARFYYALQDDGLAGALSFFMALFILAGYLATVRTRLTLAEIVIPISLGIILIWPWETFRFVMPLTPLLVYYFLIGVRLIYYLHLRLRQEPRQPSWKGLTAVALLLALINIYGNVSYLSRKFSSVASERPEFLRVFDDNMKALDFMKRGLAYEGVIATDNPAIINLFTGRHTLALDEPAKNWETWKRLNVRYMARISALPISEPSPVERRYTMVYRDQGEMNLNLRVIDLGPPDIREPWTVFGIPPGKFITN
jgi:hypothetical protein